MPPTGTTCPIKARYFLSHMPIIMRTTRPTGTTRLLVEGGRLENKRIREVVGIQRGGGLHTTIFYFVDDDKNGVPKGTERSSEM